MLVKAKIIDVEERLHKEKIVADVTLKFTDPAEAVVTTLWNNVVQKGEHKQFAELAGQEVMLAIRPEVFNGNLKFAIISSVKPILIGKPAVTKAA